MRVPRVSAGRIALFCFVLHALPGDVGGQQVRDTVQLEELVATATRVPLSLESLTAAVTVISGDELRDRGVRFVSDVLRDLPGATVVPVGSFGGVTSLFLRGGESDYVKVMVDGTAINLPGGSFNFANLTTDNVDRIEVVRGPASVLYGSDAVTGVVQIFTKQGRDGVTVEASGTKGTFGSTTFGTSVLGAHGEGRVAYSLSASRFSTNGTGPFNSDYANTVVSGTVRATIDQQTTASLVVRHDDNTVHFPTDVSGVASD
ncbi:MAG: TonB-dependent receptor, partial [Gemmatimonadales bacterium]|nr:TonB-dependent receptor [Gemmatimonadales bacterium]